MANVPIEKKGGVPWWIWPIVAAIVIALLIWLFAGPDRDAQPAQAATTTSAPVLADSTNTNGTPTDSAATSGAVAAADGASGTANRAPITDLATLLNGPADAVVGRQVGLANVPAGAVPADAGFWVTGHGGKRE